MGLEFRLCSGLGVTGVLLNTSERCGFGLFQALPEGAASETRRNLRAAYTEAPPAMTSLRGLASGCRAREHRYKPLLQVRHLSRLPAPFTRKSSLRILEDPPPKRDSILPWSPTLRHHEIDLSMAASLVTAQWYTGSESNGDISRIPGVNIHRLWHS